MPCHGPRVPPPLEEYAEHLRQQHRACDGVQTLSLSPDFPMYTVPLSAVLQMVEIKPHERLLEDGVLTEFQEHLGRAMFASHQWVSTVHPDPDLQQFRVMQEVLQKILSGSVRINMELDTEVRFGLSKVISAEDFTAKPLFLWYDYFSCPQLESQAAQGHATNLQKAIDSIPAYVARCELFIALCPTVERPSAVFNYFSWADRGWCRVEQTVREICSWGNLPWIVVTSANHAEVMRMVGCMNSPCEGAFAVAEDRAKIAPMLQQVYTKSLQACLVDRQFLKYRILLNKENLIMRGFPLKLGVSLPGMSSFLPEVDQEADSNAQLLQSFLHRNGFRTLRERDGNGLSPLCYAAMNGHPMLITALLESRANPNDRVAKHVASMGLTPNFPAVGLAALFRNHEAVEVLLDFRADVDAGRKELLLVTPLSVACRSGDVQGIRLLLERRADPHVKDVSGATAFTYTLVGNSPDAMEEMIARVDDLHLEQVTLHNPSLKRVEMADRLIKAKADIEEVFSPKTLSPNWAFQRIFSLLHRFGTKTKLRYWARQLPGSTPLMTAILCGNWDVAAVLLVSGAQTSVRNANGRTAEDLAEELMAPSYIMDALRGASDRCEALVSKMICRPCTSSWTDDDQKSHVSI